MNLCRCLQSALGLYPLEVCLPHLTRSLDTVKAAKSRTALLEVFSANCGQAVTTAAALPALRYPAPCMPSTPFLMIYVSCPVHSFKVPCSLHAIAILTTIFSILKVTCSLHAMGDTLGVIFLFFSFLFFLLFPAISPTIMHRHRCTFCIQHMLQSKYIVVHHSTSWCKVE